MCQHIATIMSPLLPHFFSCLSEIFQRSRLLTQPSLVIEIAFKAPLENLIHGRRCGYYGMATTLQFLGIKCLVVFFFWYQKQWDRCEKERHFIVDSITQTKWQQMTVTDPCLYIKGGQISKFFFHPSGSSLIQK